MQVFASGGHDSNVALLSRSALERPRLERARPTDTWTLRTRHTENPSADLQRHGIGT
jgi:hypothetical protein